MQFAISVMDSKCDLNVDMGMLAFQEYFDLYLTIFAPLSGEFAQFTWWILSMFAQVIIEMINFMLG